MKVSDLFEQADGFTITHLNNRVYVTLNSIAPLAYDIPHIKDLPHARINPKYEWDRRETGEHIVPTLEWVQTTGQYQGQGVGRKLVDAILQFMVENNIPVIVFDNFAPKFWEAMRIEKRGLVVMPKRFNNSIGFLVNPTKKTKLPF